jgi:hypothetical protein
MFTVFWDSQGVLLAHFQKYGENINPASNCEVLFELRDAVRGRRPGKLARGVLHHTARATQEGIQELQWELLEHPPNSPYLVPSDFPPEETALVANVSMMTKRLKRRRGSG